MTYGWSRKSPSKVKGQCVHDGCAPGLLALVDGFLGSAQRMGDRVDYCHDQGPRFGLCPNGILKPGKLGL
jgi:hypothetical protein